MGISASLSILVAGYLPFTQAKLLDSMCWDKARDVGLLTPEHADSALEWFAANVVKTAAASVVNEVWLPCGLCRPLSCW